MCTVRFIGCLHLGHEAIARYRGFQESYYHDEYLVNEWNKVVAKGDITYILGDVTMEKEEHYHILDQLNGRKKVVLGNHDKGKDVNELLKYVDEVAGAVDYKGYILTHVPIHPNEVLFYRGNIHAHIHHENKLQPLEINHYDTKELHSTDNKYINVDAKLLNFKPISIAEFK